MTPARGIATTIYFNVRIMTPFSGIFRFLILWYARVRNGRRTGVAEWKPARVRRHVRYDVRWSAIVIFEIFVFEYVDGRLGSRHTSGDRQVNNKTNSAGLLVNVCTAIITRYNRKFRFAVSNGISRFCRTVPL